MQHSPIRVAMLAAILAAFVHPVAAAVPRSAASAAPAAAQEVQPAPGDVAALPPQIAEIQQALGKFRAGDVVAAELILKKALAAHPELPPPPLIIAQWFSEAKQPDAVRRWLDKAAGEHPADPEAYAILGDLNIVDYRWTEAKLLFEEAARRGEVFSGPAERRQVVLRRARLGLAAVAEAREDWPAARELLQKAVAEAPSDAGVLARLGRVLFREGKTDEALEQFRAAAKASPEALTPEANLALLYESTGDRTAATQWMIKALEQAPRNLRTRLAAAQWSLETGQLKQAHQQVDAALALDPASLEAQALRGLVAMFQKDFDAAISAFEKILTQAPGNPAATNQLALALVEKDDQQKRRALEYAETAARQQPNQPQALATLGWIYYRLGRLDDAEATLQRAAQVSHGQLDPNTAYYIARLSADRGRPAEAIRLLEAVLRSAQPFPWRAEAEALLTQLKKSPPAGPRTAALGSAPLSVWGG